MHIHFQTIESILKLCKIGISEIRGIYFQTIESILKPFFILAIFTNVKNFQTIESILKLFLRQTLENKYFYFQTIESILKPFTGSNATIDSSRVSRLLSLF